MLTAERLRELVRYDPETGIFTNRITRNSKALKDKPSGGLGAGGYIQITLDGITYYAHRLAVLYVTGSWPSNQIDHENKIRSDNKWNNLRDATSKQNRANTDALSNSKTGVKGVRWRSSTGRYLAEIRLNNRHIHLGSFETIEEAAAAYKAAAVLAHGKFARS